MGFFSELFGAIMNQSNDYQNQGFDRHQSYNKREPTAEDYIRRGEIEEDNYDEGTRNYIDEHGELPEDREE